MSETRMTFQTLFRKKVRRLKLSRVMLTHTRVSTSIIVASYFVDDRCLTENVKSHHLPLFQSTHPYGDATERIAQFVAVLVLT